MFKKNKVSNDQSNNSADVAPIKDESDSEKWLQLGETAQAQGKLDRAITCYTRAAEAGNIAACFRLAVLAYRDANTELARTWLAKATDDGNLENINDAGLCARDFHDYEEGERYYRKAAEAGLAGSMLNYARVLRDRKEYDEAKNWYLKALDAGALTAYCQLGITTQWRGDDAEADEWFHKGAAAGDSWSMKVLGETAQDEGNLPEAKRWYQQSAELGYAPAMRHLGLLLVRENEIDQARNWFGKAANKGDAESMRFLGELAFDDGDSQEALTWWDKAARAGNVEAVTAMATFFKSEGDLSYAKELFEIAANDGDPEAMNQLAIMLDAENLYNEATSWYEKAADAGNLWSINQMGMRAMRLGDWDTAKQRWELAAQHGEADSMWHLGVCAEDAGDLALAKEWYQRAVDHSADYSDKSIRDYRQALLRVENLLGVPSEVVDSDDGAGVTAIDFKESDGWIERGLKAYEEGNLELAEKWFLKAAEAYNPIAEIYLASLAYGADDKIKGNMWYQRALNAAADISDPEKLTFIGDYAFQGGDFQHAAVIYRHATELGYGPAMAGLGNCLVQLNKPPAETDEWYYQAALWLLKNDQQFCETLPYGIPIYSWNYDADKVREFPGELDAIKGTFYGNEYTCGLLVDGGFVGVPTFNTIEKTLQLTADRISEVNNLHELPEFRDAELKIMEMLDKGAPYSKTDFEQLANYLISALKDPYFKILAAPAPLPEPEELRHRAVSQVKYARDGLKSIAANPSLSELTPSSRQIIPSFYPRKRDHPTASGGSPT